MRLLGLLLFSTAAFADVRDAAKILEQTTAPLPAALRQSFRLRGAASLERRFPDLSRQLVDLVLADNAELTGPSLRRLSELRPDELPKIYSRLGSGARMALLGDADTLLKRWSKERPTTAVSLFGAMAASFPYDSFTPGQAWSLLNCAATMSELAPGPSRAAAEKLENAAKQPDFGKLFDRNLSFSFEIGGKLTTTTDPREMILLMTGARLHDRGPLVVKGMRRVAQSGGAQPSLVPKLRAAASDAERARLAIDAAKRIAELPAGIAKRNDAQGLANLVTEGDLGREAINAVARTLAASLREAPGFDDSYLTLASLIRYERADVPDPEPAVRAAASLLALREEIHRQAGFTLTGLDGKTYTLDGLKGRVVLLNFWATWCPPCRKEMPDLDKLYRELGPKGLVVLAASDEDRETVAKFAGEMKYAFPIALDPGRKTHEAFDIEGIPNTYLFDREGRLAGQAMDMRTERQFREMLGRVGIR